jgi:hypothetical protein
VPTPAPITSSSAFYVEDGVIDLAGGKSARGNEAAAFMVNAPGHQAALKGGLAHVASVPRIEISGLPGPPRSSGSGKAFVCRLRS